LATKRRALRGVANKVTSEPACASSAAKLWPSDPAPTMTKGWLIAWRRVVGDGVV
jgi:hypothetical protein